MAKVTDDTRSNLDTERPPDGGAYSAETVVRSVPRELLKQLNYSLKAPKVPSTPDAPSVPSRDLSTPLVSTPIAQLITDARDARADADEYGAGPDVEVTGFDELDDLDQRTDEPARRQPPPSFRAGSGVDEIERAAPSAAPDVRAPLQRSPARRASRYLWLCLLVVVTIAALTMWLTQ